MRLWWNWQTRYFEVVVAQAVQVQVLLSAPILPRKRLTLVFTAQIPYNKPLNLNQKP